MFHRFNNSARTVAFRARDNAASESSPYIESRHILIALRHLHPELFARLADDRGHVESVNRERGLASNPKDISQSVARIRFSDQSKRVLLSATEEARLSSKRWEVDERHLLLGLLKNPDCPMVALLIERGMSADMVRQQHRIGVK
jgi:ATP-dependent Clp protease ATP-binding subunit ClpA